MPKNIFRKFIDFFNPYETVEVVSDGLSSLVDQIRQPSNSFTGKIKKILNDDISEMELEVHGRADLQNAYKKAIKQLKDFKYENVGEKDFQDNLNKIQNDYKYFYQDLTQKYTGFELSCFSLFQDQINDIVNKVYLIRQKYDRYVEEKCETDKLLIKIESENIVNSLKEEFYKGCIYCYQDLVDFYTEKKSNYIDQTVRPIQRFYREGIHEESISSYCLKQEQYVENELENLRNKYFISRPNSIKEPANFSDNNTVITIESNDAKAEDSLAELNKKYSEQKIELKMMFTSIKKSLLSATNESQFEQRKQAAKNQIRQFYKDKMIFLFHPDKNPTSADEAKEKFQFFKQKIEEIINLIDQITYSNLGAFEYKINSLSADDSFKTGCRTVNFSPSYARVTVAEIRELTRDFQKIREEWKGIGEVLSEVEEGFHQIKEDYRQIKEDYRQIKEDYRQMTASVYKRLERKNQQSQSGVVDIKRRETILKEEMKAWDNSADKNNSVLPRKQKSRSFSASTSVAGVACHTSWFSHQRSSDSEIDNPVSVSDEFIRNNQLS